MNVILLYSDYRHTMAVRKVSSHFEYHENRARGLDVIWQPVRGDLTVHPWTVALPWGKSVGSEMPLTQLVYCVTVALTNSSLSTAILDLGKARSRRETNLGYRGGGAERPGWCDALPKKSVHDCCRMGWCIVVMKLIFSLGHCESYFMIFVLSLKWARGSGFTTTQSYYVDHTNSYIFSFCCSCCYNWWWWRRKWTQCVHSQRR